MPPPPLDCSTVVRVITFLLKIVMFALLLASLVVLATDTATVPLGLFLEPKVHFDDTYAYRYMFATIVIGLVYSLLQTGFTLYHLATGNQVIAGNGAFIFDFYGDKVTLYVVATGSAAGFGVTKDLKALVDAENLNDLDEYFDKAYVSASLLLLAFFCAAILSVFSSYALPRVINVSSS